MKLKICIYAVIMMFIPLLSSAQKYKIDRLEPAFWWAGMTNPELQLLVYGENISELSPVIQHESITIKNTVSIANPNYLFINLILDKETKAGKFTINFTQKKKTVLSYEYELLERNTVSASIEGFNTSDAIYLITPDRFANGTTENDNIEGMKEKINRNQEDRGGRHGGDLKGIADNIDYLKDMGFTAIWLNPVIENDMETYSYHGYAATDFYQIDKRYGSNEEYKAFAQKLHDNDMKLIMDMIMNHCGSDHWWMKDLPSEDWINNKGKYIQTNHRHTTIQDPHASERDLYLMTDGWFVETMPDINQRNPLVSKYLIQNTIWWIEYIGLNGIRMDTYPYPDKEFMSQWCKAIIDEYPNINIVGEEWNENPAIVSYWQKGKINSDGYVSYLPSLMDFPLQAAARDALNHSEGWSSGLTKLYEVVGLDFLYPDPDALVIFPDNHDMSRIYTQLNEDFDYFKMNIATILTMRGVPQFFYGTEVLMSNKGTGHHGIIRSEFPGGWSDSKKNGFTGEGLTDKEKEAKQFMKTLLNWRKTSDAVINGKLIHYIPENGTYVYFRYTNNDKVMVVLNKNNEEHTLDLSRFGEIIKGNESGKEIISGKNIKFDGKLVLPAKSAMIIEGL